MMNVRQLTRIRNHTGGAKCSILLAASRVRNADATDIAINVMRVDHK